MPIWTRPSAPASSETLTVHVRFAARLAAIVLAVFLLLLDLEHNRLSHLRQLERNQDRLSGILSGGSAWQGRCLLRRMCAGRHGRRGRLRVPHCAKALRRRLKRVLGLHSSLKLRIGLRPGGRGGRTLGGRSGLLRASALRGWNTAQKRADNRSLGRGGQNFGRIRFERRHIAPGYLRLGRLRILPHDQLEASAVPDHRHGDARSSLESVRRAHIDGLAEHAQACRTSIEHRDYARFDNLAVPREIAKFQTAALLRNQRS